MVFESVVAYFLDKYLSNYIEDFDSSNLKIGIWNGNVTLENLNLKSNALDELELPVRVVFGHLKKLTLKIPWKSLYSESVKATIDGLTILVAPLSSFSYDEEREKKESIDRKLKEVKRLIELEKLKSKTKIDQDEDTDQKSDTFSERIQMQVIRNLELEIKNIHVRYEDDFSKPEHPFSAGFTLNSIEIKTTDENWQPTYLKEDKILVNKIASLVSFAIYCNSDDKLLKIENKDYSIRMMQNMINNFTEAKYILKPLSLSSKATLNMKPAQNEFSSPLFDFTIILESISLSLNRLQYFDTVNLLSTIDFMTLKPKYQKYHIKDSDKNKMILLWKFAYKAICETIIKPKKFKWTKLKFITKTRKDYVNILKKKAKNPKLSPEEIKEEKKCEEILDVFNLMLARKQADVEIARIAKQEASSKSSWWGWLSSSSSQTENKDNSDEFNLSSEEKEKLYNAIGYTENTSITEYPEKFIGLRLKFILKKFELELINAEYKDKNRSTTFAEYSLLHLIIENMEADLMQYPTTKGFGISSSVKNIHLNGSSIDSNNKNFTAEKEEKPPALIEADLKQEKFLQFNYTFNPKDKSCNKRLSLFSKSLRFTYHAITVNNIVSFFRSTESSTKIRLKNAALKSINQVKQRSILYMKNKLQNIQQMDVNVDISPSYLIVPKKGNIQQTDELIFLNFGHLSFKSEPKNEELLSDEEEKYDSADDESFEEKINKKYKQKDKQIELEKVNEELERSKSQVFQASYWKYKIQLTQIQILLINEQKQIEMVKNQTADKSLFDSLYVLTPLDITLNIHQCVFTDDETLPALKVFGNLPIIEFSLTDKKIEKIIFIFLSIPFPSQKELSKIDMLDTSFIDEAVEESKELPFEIEKKSTRKLSSSQMSYFSNMENLQQALNLEFSFEINEIYFILRETQRKYFDFLSFNIKSFGTKLLQKSYDTCIDVYLTEIKCEYGLFNDSNGSTLYLINSSKREPKCNLIDMKMTITDSQSPTLKLLHDNVLVNIELDLCAIDLVVNLVALKNMMSFIDEFNSQLISSVYFNFEKDIENFEKKIKKDKTDDRPLLHERRIIELLNKKESNTIKNKKSLIDFDLVETKIKARFEGVRARLSTSRNDYFYIDVNQLELNSIGKIGQFDVNFSLNSISIIDLEQAVVYNKILCPQEDSENLVSINLTLSNPPKTPLSQVSKLAAQYQREIFYFKNYMNQDHFDLSVKARVLKLKMIFQYATMNKLMGLLRILDNNSTKDSLAEKTNTIKDVNTEEQTARFLFLYRIKLDIDIEAPLIIVPESLLSLNALMLDCGHLNVKTNLEVNKSYFKSKNYKPVENLLNDICQIPPVIEIQNVKISKMDVSRVKLDNSLEILTQIILVDCSQLTLTIRRNLQPLIYHDIESINVKAEYGGLIATIARSDYSFIIQLLQNMSEIPNKLQDIDIPELPLAHQIKSQAKQQLAEGPEINSSKKADSAKIIINLSIESIQMYLHDENYSQINDKLCVRLKENAFSNMELKNLNLEMKIYENTENERDSIKIMFLLDTIILDDTTQIKSGKKPIRLIEKYSSKKSTFGPMIIVQYEQKTSRSDDGNETHFHFIPEKNVNIRLSFMRACLNVDYLLSLYEFFVEGLPKKSESVIDKIDLELRDEENFDLNQRLLCDIVIENPQFIFYEDQNELIKSNSFIIDALLRFNFSLMNKKTKISLWIDDLMFRLRCYVMKKILTRKTYVFLSPTMISFSGVIEESEEYKSAEDLQKQNQLFMLDVQKISLNLSPQMLSTFFKMINSIQNSINKKFNMDSLEVREESKIKLESLFQTVAFQPEDFWFTKRKIDLNLSGSSLVSSESGFSISSSEQSSQSKNQIMFRTQDILIKIESGLSDQQPLLCLNILANGEFINWTRKPSLSVEIVCQMAYFNESLSVWEPVIELVEFKSDHLKPFEISIQMVTNVQSEHLAKAKKEKNHHFTNLKPVRTFQINSTLPLQFVVTKTFLSMLDTLSQTFVLSEELLDNKPQQHLEYFSFDQEEEFLLEKLQNKLDTEESFDSGLDEDSPSFDFLIKNELGFDVVLKSIKGFKFQNIDSIDPMRHKTLVVDRINLKNNCVCPISLEYDFMHSFESGRKALEEPEKIRNSLKFSLEIENNEWEPVIINLNQSNLTGFNLSKKNSANADSNNDKLIICETVTKLDKKRIYLRSPVRIVNRMNIDIALSYPMQEINQKDYSFSNTIWKDTIILAGDKWNLPIELMSNKFTDFVKLAPIIAGVNFEKSPLSWYSKIDHRLFEFGNHVFFQAIIEKSVINVVQNNINKIDYLYNIVLIPTVTIYNFLPYPIKYEIINEDFDKQHSSYTKEQSTFNYLKPGAFADLINGKFGSSLYIKIENYFDLSWSSSFVIEFNKEIKNQNLNEETNMIEFRSSTSKIVTIYSNLVRDNYRGSLTLFAPYWILNQTRLSLDYKFEELSNEINTIDPTFTDKPFFLKINSKIFNLQNKKLMVRVNERDDSTSWSNAFAIDAVGNNGTVSSKSINNNGKLYEFGIDIKLQKSSNGLTKIIKLTPYYLLINQTNSLLDLRQIKQNEVCTESLCLEPNSINPFWPSIDLNSKEKPCICVRVLNHRNEVFSKIPFSKPFWYNEKHTTVLTYGEESPAQILVIECVPSQEIIRLIIKPFEYGMAPVLVLNCLSNHYIILKQNEEPNDETFLMAGHYCIKTWSNPTGKRELLWSCGLSSNQIYNLDTLETKKTFEISQGKFGYCLSFLDGLQKVLIFTDTLGKLNEDIVGSKEIKGDEYVLSLTNLGLSLIDDINQMEILYFSLTSSSIDWGERTTKKKIFKSFATYKTEKIEQAYQKYLQSKEESVQQSSSSLLTSSNKLFQIDEEDEVDFERMVLFVGKQEISIERQYAPGLYINLFKSLDKTTIHLVIHKLQIDNQLYDCVFPVLFSKVLPPKSMITTNVFKPIIELSMVQNHSQQTKTTEMKYFQVLIQEFSVKIDINLLNALSKFLTSDGLSMDKKKVRDSTEFFKEINEIKKSFHDVFETLENLNEKKQKNDKIYYDHVHISPIKIHFSFSLAGTDAFKNTNIFLNNPLSKSIGLVLTDIQDAVFRLGFFEISNTVYTSKELSDKIIDHYKNQVIKQSYIIFLGLDVLGNPFGLISGLAGGVKSLFYEPWAGVVQGPGEFVEGVSIGLRSFAGGTIGGAAGAFSKITGTLGKGLATLTMDKEFQKSRQKTSDARSNIVQSFAQNLGKGFVSGITGLYEKPKEGLAEGGLGVFKGFGKAILGVVAKPTTGAIDFASQTLEGVRKITVQEESVNRSRPPRAIYGDRIIRPYKLKEAQAVFIYKTMEKSAFLHDVYKASIEISNDHKEFLIATNRHLFLVKTGAILGNWNIEWNFEYEDLLHEPRLVKNSIEIVLKKKGSSIFGSGDQTKKVAIKNEAQAIRFLTKVQQVIREKDF